MSVSDDIGGNAAPRERAGRENAGSSAARPIPGSVLALGSAVVLAVYGAGYYRTRDAAARFADEAVGRPAPRTTGSAAGPGDRGAPPIDGIADGARSAGSAGSARVRRQNAGGDDAPKPVASGGAGVARREARVKAGSSATAGRTVTTMAPAAGEAPREAVTPLPAAGASAAPVQSAAAAPVAAPSVASSTPVAAGPAPAAPASLSGGAAVPPGGPGSASPVPAASLPPLTADTAHTLGLHDGTYTGWGTSRHGDIEATVVVANGRIASASISRCLTRYSCSWIAHLQKQVVDRQSPEVDYVSGATQSTNAFYYAVVEALSKAK